MQPNKRKIMFISRDYPTEASGGSSTYRLSLLRFLQAEDCEIVYALLPYLKNDDSISDSSEVDTTLLPGATIEHLHYEKAAIVPVWNSGTNDAERFFVDNLIKKYSSNLVIIDRPWLCDLFERNGPDKNFITAVLTHDVQYKKIEQYKRMYTYPYKRNKRKQQPDWNREIEASYLSRADIIMAIQEEDYDCFKALLPNSTVAYVPLATTPQRQFLQGQVSGRVLFVGGGAQHNISGITWFLQKVWPAVIRGHPAATLHICGEVCDSIPEYADVEGVMFRGKVKDIGPEYQAASVCVVPLIIGGGLKIKLIEAMSYGRACVSTTIGVQGIEAVGRYGVDVSNDPMIFSTQLKHLLANSSKRKLYEAKNREFITNFLSPQKIYGDFLSLSEKQHVK